MSVDQQDLDTVTPIHNHYSADSKFKMPAPVVKIC